MVRLNSTPLMTGSSSRHTPAIPISAINALLSLVARTMLSPTANPPVLSTGTRFDGVSTSFVSLTGVPMTSSHPPVVA